MPAFWKFSINLLFDHDNWCSIIEYPNLISLDIIIVDVVYVENFLNDTKTHLPCLVELEVDYNQLETVTRNNYAKIKRLILLEESAVDLKEIRHYFTSLSIECCPNTI